MRVGACLPLTEHRQGVGKPEPGEVHRANELVDLTAQVLHLVRGKEGSDGGDETTVEGENVKDGCDEAVRSSS
jgi:hypothetical protein